MTTKILFIGVDVDDNSFHGSYLTREREVQGSFKCKPYVGALSKKLTELKDQGYQIKICYEATHIGFSLLRDLQKSGFECEVIAPSLIPTYTGLHKKTDRLDAQKLAEFYSQGLLTAVYVPSTSDESTRGLIRSRDAISTHIKRMKTRIIATCRLQGLHYHEEVSERRKYANHWTSRHRLWLEGKVNQMQDPVMKLNFSLMLLTLHQMEEILSRYDAEIERLATEIEYQKKVDALKTFRGIKTLTALSLVVELGDIRRFDHPSRVTSYAGMDIREYSSGGKERKFSITKMGNVYLRTRMIESCQWIMRPPKLGKPLLERRKNVDANIIEIADRCMLRLHKKAVHLQHRGKHRNTIKVACAREMLCFVWECLKKVS